MARTEKQEGLMAIYSNPKSKRSLRWLVFGSSTYQLQLGGRGLALAVRGHIECAGPPAR